MLCCIVNKKSKNWCVTGLDSLLFLCLILCLAKLQVDRKVKLSSMKLQYNQQRWPMYDHRSVYACFIGFIGTRFAYTPAKSGSRSDQQIPRRRFYAHSKVQTQVKQPLRLLLFNESNIVANFVSRKPSLYSFQTNIRRTYLRFLAIQELDFV